MDFVLLEEGLQESLKDGAGKLAIALLPLNVALDGLGSGQGGWLGGLRDIGNPHAASEDKVCLHFGPPGKVVCPLEQRDLGQGNDLRVGGGGSGIPGRRHCKVSVNAVC